MELHQTVETWPTRGVFAIARGQKTAATVIVVSVRDGAYAGTAECVPYPRYGETVESVQAQIESVRLALEQGAGRETLQLLLPRGAARNALDCALWDLEAKKSGKTIWQILGIEPTPQPTAFTIGLDTPEDMAELATRAAEQYSILKIKLGGEGDRERLQAVREAAPAARLIVDVNEGWNAENVSDMVRACESVGVELIEQPLPADNDAILAQIQTSIKICADESAHVSDDIPKLFGRYTAVNIKLDKTGGLTEAMAMMKVAKDANFSVMVGCMVSTSLSMAPATVLAQAAAYVDLDGPLLLEKDREQHIRYQNGMILPTQPELWG